MSVHHVSSLTELQSYIAQPKLTVVDFFATWCGPCRMIGPQIEQLAQQRPNINFCKVDVDAARDITNMYPVRAMPTFYFFKSGSKLHSFEGADINAVNSAIQQFGN